MVEKMRLFFYWVGEQAIFKWEPMCHMLHILPEPNSSHLKLRWCFQICLFFIPKIGVSWSNLTKTRVFQLGLNPPTRKTLVGRQSFPSREGLQLAAESCLFILFEGVLDFLGHIQVPKHSGQNVEPEITRRETFIFGFQNVKFPGYNPLIRHFIGCFFPFIGMYPFPPSLIWRVQVPRYGWTLGTSRCIRGWGLGRTKWESWKKGPNGCLCVYRGLHYPFIWGMEMVFGTSSWRIIPVSKWFVTIVSKSPK